MRRGTSEGSLCRALASVQNILTVNLAQRTGPQRRKEFAILSLPLKSGEYLTIGEDIAVQVFQDAGNKIQVGIAAPRGPAVLRGEVRERNGEVRPKGIIE